MKYAIGIDLGTTHCALSYQPMEAKDGRGENQAVLPVPQLTAPGTVEAQQLLPSFLYLAAAAEFPQGSLGLPWNKSLGLIVGELARSHGAKVPTRLVSSAKSWLCHPTVDRRSAVLPWGAPADVTKISPVDASAKYLEHLRHAWDRELGKGAPLADQEVVVTVPASFDAAARDLTLEAAKLAGLPRVTLLEEPQAALYAWLEAMGTGWRKQLQPGDVLLVVDIGGGTSDFSLIGVSESGGELQLERKAVGDHILLGGDNMDLALAYTVNEKFKAAGKTLDTWQMTALTAACRVAKEHLYGHPRAEKAAVSVPGRGSSLVGGTLKSELLRAELDAVLTEGFFPKTKRSEAPQQARRSGLAQVGLPYAQDAAVTRHLGAFLTRQGGLGGHRVRLRAPHRGALQRRRAQGRPAAHPGDGHAQRLAERRRRAARPRARRRRAGPRGGARRRLLRLGGKRATGIRIRGGTARAYYVGVEASTLAVPGFTPPVKALCVAPFGMEEGTQADIPPQEFGLVVGEPTRFRFFSSSTRRDDAVGVLLENAAELEELPPIETSLPGTGGALVPVNLQAAVTELGALEVRCLERDGKGKWKLELNVRPD